MTEWERWVNHLRDLTGALAGALDRAAVPPLAAAGIPGTAPVLDPHAPTGPVVHPETVVGLPGVEEPGRAVRVGRFPVSVFTREDAVDLVAANTPVFDAPFAPPAVGTLIWGAQWSAAVAAQWSADAGDTWITLGTPTANQWTEWRWVVTPTDRVVIGTAGAVTLLACRLIYVPDVV